MSERKVLNKYFPPDFDPSKLDIKRKEKEEPSVLSAGGGSTVVRLMAPFSMRCLTCSEWIPRGKKFNARKEKAQGEHYLGIQIHRFYIRCPMCSSDITFKTDPEKTDYVCESGAQRNFEMVRDERLLEAELQKEKELEEERNPIAKLESRTLNSKREMEILETLDELRSKSAAYERGGARQAIERIMLIKHAKEQAALEKQEKQDDELAHAVFYNAEGEIIKRAPEGDPLELLKSLHQIKDRNDDKNHVKRKLDSSNDFGIVVRKKKDMMHSTKKEQEHSLQETKSSVTESKSSLNILGSVYADSSSEADN